MASMSLPSCGRSRLMTYGVATASSVGAMLLTLLIDDAALEPNTRLLLLASVFFSSWFGGLGAGLLATALNIGASLYLHAGIEQIAAHSNMTHAFGVGEFTLVSLIVTFLNAARRQEQERAERAQRIAEEANRFKDDFIAAVSHDLRTPLASMSGWANMLRTRRLDEATSTRALEAIERGAEMQRRLIDGLLDASRIATGQVRIEMQPVDLTATIRSAIEVVRPKAESEGIEMEVTLDEEASSIVGDAARLQRVMWNLLTNAVKFTPRGGHISVRLEAADECAIISVSDTGEGIAADFLPHVFERFRQEEGKRKSSGFGLGLSIVRDFIEQHGGAIEARSEGKGCGATFVIKLPLAIPASAASGAIKTKIAAHQPG